MKDRQILTHLRANARSSLAAIATSIEMPISTIHDKINKLDRDNVIKRHTTLVDFTKLGYHYQAKLAIRVSRLQKKEFYEFLTSHTAINSLHEINGGFDFLLETIHSDIKEYIGFLDELQESFDIQELHEYQIINEIKKEEFKV